MGLSEFYSAMRVADAQAAVRLGIEVGITHFDTADMYGRGANEVLLGEALRGIRSSVVLATKCGVIRSGGAKRIDGSPQYIRAACEASLRRLQTDHVDILYLHRVDTAVPVEDTIGAMADLVWDGKARYLGLSKVDTTTVRRAIRVHPIVAVQMEYSLFARDVEPDMLELCRQENVALVAYSPLCKGLLSGRILSREQLEAEDVYRRLDRRFRSEALEHTRDSLETLDRLARESNCSASQLALAWLLSRGPQVIPIPGMRTREQVLENVGAVEVQLTSSTLSELDSLLVAAS